MENPLRVLLVRGQSSHRLFDASVQCDHHLLNTAQKSISCGQHRSHLSSGVGLGDVLIFVFVLLEVLVANVLVDVLKKIDQSCFHGNHLSIVATRRSLRSRIL
ncbi:hypothetical protein TYRP_022845 [Tyrophagus putrescentiae]|nr:hypothetical protein TYRP_022845 [Tyrophagus putrescentiae]